MGDRLCRFGVSRMRNALWTDTAVSYTHLDGVNAYVDLSGYEAGTYEDVPVVIELPDDVSMTSETVGVTVVLS